jgi:hypothetical protein
VFDISHIAAELRYFCLYLSVPLLQHFLPPPYFHHWLLLVDVLLVLSSLSVDKGGIEFNKRKLLLFVIQMSVLYGPEHSGLEVHMLKHVVPQGVYLSLLCNNYIPFTVVEEFGPLWTHGAYIFEHMGGRTLLSSHGKRTAIQTSIVKHFLRLNNQRQMLIKLQMQKDSRILLTFYVLIILDLPSICPPFSSPWWCHVL